MNLHTPGQLLVDQVRDLTSAAEQMSEVLPMLIQLTTHAGLKELLSRHATVMRSHCHGLKKILEELHSTRTEDTCLAMQGLLEGGENHLVQVTCVGLRDLMMIAHCVRVQGYAIAAHVFTAYLATRCEEKAVAQDLCGMLGEHEAVMVDLNALLSEIFHAANRPER